MRLAASVAVWLAIIALFIEAPTADHLLTTAVLLAIALTAATADRLTRTERSPR